MITTAEAARRRGVSSRRIRYLIAAGRLEAQKVGRDWLVDERSLERLPRRRQDTLRTRQSDPRRD